MKVTHVINRFSESGGAENQLYMNLRAFADADIQHRVVALYALDAGVGDHDFDVTCLFPDHSSQSRWSIVKALSDELASHPPDLIHCSLADSAVASRLVGRRYRIPVLESLVNISHEPVRLVDNPSIALWKLKAHTLLDRVTMRHVRHFHAISDRVASSWEDQVRIDPDKITVIPRGVRLHTFDDENREAIRQKVRHELCLAPNSPLLINVARHEPQKGQRYLLEAMPSILREVPDTQLLIAGREGNSTRNLAELANALSITDNVHTLGVRHDVPDLLIASDVFVFPSLFEGMGVAILEAMAAQSACLVSDVAPLNDVISDGITGWTFSPGDPHDLADKAVALLKDYDLRSSLGRQARDDAERRFDIENTARRLEQLYRKII